MKKIGIIVAMDEESDAIENIMTEIKIKQIYNLRFICRKNKRKRLYFSKKRSRKSKCSKNSSNINRQF